MKRILIIEDELSIAELERDYFEINGYAVEIEQDGNSGLRRAVTEEYDLVILDLMLPGMDGFEICKQIRIEKDMPILMVSARKEEIDKIKGLGFGADDYITKPFSPSELVARVKAHLSRYERLMGKREQLHDEIKIRGIVIDKSARRVYVNDKEVTLTTKEFDLFTMLASNPNRVFSKEELFERIWGFDSVGDNGTVSVHIRKIREKTEVDPSNPQYIETLWGAGYRFGV
ncbi:response regulator transcription factor [Aneurinibacillus tyrosinisolvens]|uniref:response regulator transcription factor n=1 Tax=Aneurinibacillus tyrosinisolvens TaxID=1443435 RepID=UPI00063F9881|nr:response regulator transcription factor [Aneurinibacillus tyrosinisolvens]